MNKYNNHLNENYEVCKTCGGDGEVTIRDDYGVDCDACGGEGYIKKELDKQETAFEKVQQHIKENVDVFKRLKDR